MDSKLTLLLVVIVVVLSCCPCCVLGLLKWSPGVLVAVEVGERRDHGRVVELDLSLGGESGLVLPHVQEKLPVLPNRYRVILAHTEDGPESPCKERGEIRRTGRARRAGTCC